MPGGMPNGRSARRPSSPYSRPSGDSFGKKREPQEITRPLPLSLEDLYNGTTKHLKVSRKLRDGGTAEKILEIKVLPGYKKGTKIRFPDAGNESETGESQAITFVLEEKPHERFERDDADLILKQKEKISIADALTNAGGMPSSSSHTLRKPPTLRPAEPVRRNSSTRLRTVQSAIFTTCTASCTLRRKLFIRAAISSAAPQIPDGRCPARASHGPCARRAVLRRRRLAGWTCRTRGGRRSARYGARGRLGGAGG